jgi:Glycosyl hydrolase family 26
MPDRINPRAGGFEGFVTAPAMQRAARPKARPAKVRATIAVAVGALLVACLLTPTPAAAKRSKPGSIYWGATIGSQLTGEKAPWDMSAVTEFQRVAGKGLSLVSFLAPFAQCEAPGDCVMEKFPRTPFEEIRAYGAIPFFSWNSTFSPPSVIQPDFQLSDLIEGRYDAYIAEFAAKAREWGHPFFLRFDWEMNGFWFPWNEGVNGNKKGEFVAAWRHVHDIFTSVGATNATWVWCPNVNIYGDLANLKPLYPGERYVDWTCLDGFNWGKRRGSPGWLNFNRIYHSTYKEIVRKIAPRKPFLIGEIASSDSGGSKVHWIEYMLHQVRTRYRRVRGLVWVDVNDRNTNWPIERPRAVRNAFRRGIGNPAYVPNAFRNLTASGPIPPPTRG